MSPFPQNLLFFDVSGDFHRVSFLGILIYFTFSLKDISKSYSFPSHRNSFQISPETWVWSWRGGWRWRGESGGEGGGEREDGLREKRMGWGEKRCGDKENYYGKKNK
jgi:hypothetical protein